MILPAKHLRQDRSLLALGGRILAELDEPRSVSELWERARNVTHAANRDFEHVLSFDWFVLSLSFLYAISAIELRRGILVIRRT
jgi:hypothetical protein